MQTHATMIIREREGSGTQQRGERERLWGMGTLKNPHSQK